MQSPNLKDVAWLEDAQLFHTFVCNFCPAHRVYTSQSLQTGVRKIREINGASSSTGTSFKRGEYNLLPSIVTLQFTNCVKFNFGKSYLPSGSHTNIVISDRFAYPSRWHQKCIVNDVAATSVMLITFCQKAYQHNTTQKDG